MKFKNLIYFTTLLTIGLITINSCSKDDDCTEKTWYQDADGDGFGNANLPQQSCTQPLGYVSDNTDFDDTDASLNPNATDIADNNIDENGDGNFAYNLFVDVDGDGFGAYGTSVVLVDVPNIITVASDVPNGYSQNDGDCDDSNAATNPNATEISADGIDNNCDGYIDQIPCSTDGDCPNGMTCTGGICQ